jgi:hypothetical protein
VSTALEILERLPIALISFGVAMAVVLGCLSSFYETAKNRGPKAALNDLAGCLFAWFVWLSVLALLGVMIALVVRAGMLQFALGFLAGATTALIARRLWTHKTLYGELTYWIHADRLRSWLEEHQVRIEDTAWLDRTWIKLQCRTLNERLWVKPDYSLWYTNSAQASLRFDQDVDYSVGIAVVLEAPPDGASAECVPGPRRILVIDKLPLAEIYAYRRARDFAIGSDKARGELQKRAKAAIEHTCVSPVKYANPSAGPVGVIDFEGLMHVDYAPLLFCPFAPPRRPNTVSGDGYISH